MISERSSVLKSVVCGVLALTAATSLATSYVWNGGASGEWTQSANWSPNTGYPNGADDTASFSPSAATAVTVDSAVTVKGISISGAGKLTVTGSEITLGASGVASTSTAVCAISNDLAIAAAQTPIALTGSGPLHLGGVISGAGGLYKTGHAYVHLYGDNTFTGVYEALGDKTTPSGAAVPSDRSAGSGDTYIYSGSALGANHAYFDRWYNNNPGMGARLIIVGGMTISIPIQVTGDYNNNGSVIFSESGDVTFEGDLNCKFRARLCALVTKAIRVKGEFTHTNYLILSGPDSTEYYLHKAISGSCYAGAYDVDTSITVHLFSTESVSCNWFHARATIICENENVIPPALNCVEMTYPNSRVDLNGYNQTVTYFEANKFKQHSGWSHGFTSVKPAMFRLVGTELVSVGARWSFIDNAGFEWDPQRANVTFIQSNAVSQTRGALAVKSGKYRLANGASFTSLSSLTVGSGATFEVESGAGANFAAGTCTVAADAVFNLASGVNLKVGALSYGGSPIGVGTVLTSSTHPALITGAGTITVTGDVILPRNKWQGASGARWTDAANWSYASVPDSTCEAYVGSGKVMVDSATPSVGLITVANGATITCSGPFTNEADKATIHLVCGDLVVEKGGKIDATQKGWSGALWIGTKSATDVWTWNFSHVLGYGPGVSSSDYVGFSGADHGGLGGSWRLLDRKRVPYGDAAHPTTAGSGGDLPISWGGEIQRAQIDATTAGCRGCSGGGVIRIEATGSVRVDGEIRADGKGHANNGGSRDCASAGGSVWITCRTIAGSGTISAVGGSQGDPRFPHYYWRPTANLSSDGKYGHPGGGGRIAIDYDTDAEAAADVDGLFITAAAGEYYSSYVTLATRDLYESKAEAGTLHFSDTALPKRLFGNGLSGRVVGLSSLSFDGDLDFRRGFFQPMEEGFTLTVAGDLTITSATARLEIGGLYMTNRTARATTYAGTQVNRLTVGGDLVIDNGGSLAVRSAEQPEGPVSTWGTAAGARWGAEVSVAGAMTIGNKSCVYAAADGITLAAPKFTVGSLTVAEGGILSADRGGGLGKDFRTQAMMMLFFGTSSTSAFAATKQANHMDWYGYGPGGGYKNNAAGHGGKGGRSLGTVDGSQTYGNEGIAYDDEWFPVWAGSGGGSIFETNDNPLGSEGGTGGGIIHVTSAGPIVVNGTVSADGWCGSYIWNSSGTLTSGVKSQGGGSGGTVYLAGETFAAGANAKISAKGGSTLQSKNNSYNSSGTGGGGRIAIWTGANHYLTGVYKTVKLAERPAEIADVFDASAGDPLFVDDSTRNEKQMAVLMGKDGTVAFGRFVAKRGIAIIIK